MSSQIIVRAGDSLSLAGVATLPAGNWSASSSFSTIPSGNPPRTIAIPVSMSLIAPNESNPTKNDWAITLHATAAVTATWPVVIPGQNPMRGAIKFRDDSESPITKTTGELQLFVLPNIVP
jgi:hypothetical protein